MVLGIPWSLKIVLRKAFATVAAVKGHAKGMKCVNLVSLSITTRITSNLANLGKPSTKKIDISCQAESGIGNGYSNPGVEQFSVLHLIHISYLVTHSVIHFFSLGQKKCCFTLAIVFLIPECPPIGELWRT